MKFVLKSSRKANILFDINHPAHVHYFRNVIHRLIEQGNQVTVVSRNKEIEHELLELYGIQYLSRGKGGNSLISRLIYHFFAVVFLIKVILVNQVDLIVSFMHPYAAQAGWLTGIPRIVFSDTENADLHHKLTIPFATEIHTPFTFRYNLGPKHKSFKSFMELAYLNKKYFQPDKKLFVELIKDANNKKVLVRFVSRDSLHDSFHKGLTVNEKINLVEGLSQFCKVYITSEVEIPDPIKKYQVNVPKNKIHDFLYYCDFFIGESATMSAESALLGTPAIYIDDEGRGYTDYLEKEYQLIYRVNENLKGIDKAINYAKNFKSKSFSKSWLDVTELHTNYIDTTEYILNQISRLLGRSL